MSSNLTWLVTGASSGIGSEVVRAAVNAGDRVVATARSLPKLEHALEDVTGDLLCVPLDVTDPQSIDAAVAETVETFGAIDVFVNNAGYGMFGAFEMSSREDAQAQFATNVFGLMEVTRGVLPVMRRNGGGHVINFSSISGIHGLAGSALYSASKFAVEGFSEALAGEVGRFDIKVTIIEPGQFNTAFLDDGSVRFGGRQVAGYEEYGEALREMYISHGRRQGKDPRGLAELIVAFTRLETPPRRFPAGADAVRTVETKSQRLLADLAQWRELSLSLE